MPAPAKPVDRADLVRGFDVSKNKYLLLEKEELDAVRLESTRILDIEEFVDASEIDRIYWDEPYYLAPSGKTGIEAYAVIRAAMEKQKKVALGRVVMHQRERICALEPRDKGILLTTLRTHDEIRATSEVFDRSLPKPNAQMLQIAEKIIEQQDAKFDPTALQGSLRGRVARADRQEEEGRARRLRGAGGRRREGRRPDGGAEEEPQGRRRAFARQGRPLPRSAWAEQGEAQGKSQDEDPSQDRVTQARGVAAYSCRSHATGCGTPSTVRWRKVTP